MRTKTISISERDLMFAIGGQLFGQAPNRQPRKAEIIMQKVRDAFRKDAHNWNEFYSLEIEKGKLYGYLDAMLKGITEFEELNLTQEEYEKGISVDDDNRPKYAFVTRYDVETSDSWKTDFIDLDAFVRNAHRMVLILWEVEQDCWGCRNAAQEGKPSTSETCSMCSVNPKLKYNYECNRHPKGEYTFSCEFNCTAHHQICCEECNEKDGCPNKCDGESNSCGNKVME